MRLDGLPFMLVGTYCGQKTLLLQAAGTSCQRR